MRQRAGWRSICSTRQQTSKVRQMRSSFHVAEVGSAAAAGQGRNIQLLAAMLQDSATSGK